jgi:hypothetical protein
MLNDPLSSKMAQTRVKAAGKAVAYGTIVIACDGGDLRGKGDHHGRGGNRCGIAQTPPPVPNNLSFKLNGGQKCISGG